MDIILDDQSDDRYVLFPIKSEAIWKLYKKHVDSFWRAEEIDLSKDSNDWFSLSEHERDFTLRILAFFAASDGIVSENLAMRFYNDVKLPEARSFYAFQIMMEHIHSETYSILIDTFGGKKKTELFKATENYPCIKQKAEWAKKYISGNQPFEERLVAFACVEGIFFSGAFCAIFWLKKRGLMQGLTLSNEFISRDEALHTEFAVLLHSLLLKKCSSSKILDIVKDAVKIEQEFICESLPCRLIGMNSKMMATYIEFVADYLLTMLGCEKHYKVSNPFSFMEMISLDGKTNFFERRVSEYALANTDYSKDVFNMTADF